VGLRPLQPGPLQPDTGSVIAALAPEDIRGSAFGLLATIQAGGNVLASAVAGPLYTFAGPTLAFLYVSAWLLIALVLLGLARPSAVP
jgi:MFS family permease